MSDHDVLEPIALSPAERDALRTQAVCRADFILCGNRVRLGCNTRHPLDSFAAWYAGFESHEATDAPADLAVWCRHDTGPDGEVMTFLAGDAACRLRHPELIRNIVPTLDHLILPRIRTHYLVHAGCVSRNGRAIVVSGESGMGKTTLTAFLAARGMEFLSDEIAPICRTTGRVAPFPLHVGIRPGPAAGLTRALPGVEAVCGTDRKKRVDPRHLGRSVAAGPAPLHAVVFLTHTLTDKVMTPLKFNGSIRVMLLGATGAFVSELCAKTGATLRDRTPVEPQGDILRLETPDPAGFLPALRAVTHRHGAAIVTIDYEDLDPKDFTRAPELRPVPTATGVLELLKKMSASQKNALLASDFAGRLPLLVSDVANAVRDVAFYKLSPGRLDDMLAAIATLP